jgi:hypothetical protein
VKIIKNNITGFSSRILLLNDINKMANAMNNSIHLPFNDKKNHGTGFPDQSRIFADKFSTQICNPDKISSNKKNDRGYRSFKGRQ